MKQPRELLEQNLIKPTLEIKRRRGVVKDIKKHLVEKYSLFEGSIQSWINDPASRLKNIDTRLLCLFAEQIHQKTGNPEIDIRDYFTEVEIKKSKEFTGKLLIEEEIGFPLTLDDARQTGRDSWTVMMDIHTIVGLLNARKLHWNPDTQREATTKVINGEIIETPTLYMQNVLEIADLLKKGLLESTQLTFNITLGSSDESDDMHFNDATKQLTISRGAICNILDGMHRIVGSQLALSEKPDIEFEFEVKFLNFGTDRAAKYLSQIAKQTPISETKRRIMSKETPADVVAKELMEKSALKDRVSKKEGLTKARKELVTYNTLVNSIEQNFDLTKKVYEYETFDYLKEFFEALLGYYETEFTTEYDKYKKESLINDNNVVGAGFIVLAKRMKQKNIEARQVKKYIENINFARTNPEWNSLGILDEKLNLTKNAKTNIEKFFSEIEV